MVGVVGIRVNRGCVDALDNIGIKQISAVISLDLSAFIFIIMTLVESIDGGVCAWVLSIGDNPLVDIIMPPLAIHYKVFEWRYD